MFSVLYVDDEPTLLELGKFFLEETGQFSIDIIPSASGALPLLDRQKYDAIISDYQMPSMDGIEFLKTLRDSGNDTPFILFTGRGREEIVIEAINNGADFYLQKGGDPAAQFAELAHKIRQAVTRRNAQEELRAAYEQITAREEELRSQYDELVVSEHRIRESERMFRELFDMVPLSCCVTDKDGRFTLVNRTFEETSGYSSSEVLGKTGIELGLNSPGTEQDLMQGLAKTGRIESTESVTRLRNGEERTTLISARSVSINASPHIITAVFDITDRKRAEESLRTIGKYFRAMIDQSPFSIIVFTPDGNAVYANEAHCRFWGITMDRVRGYNVFRDPQVERLGLIPAFHRAFAGEQLTVPPTGYDLGATLGAGLKKMVRGDFYPIRDENGTVTHVILVHQDFPERPV